MKVCQAVKWNVMESITAKAQTIVHAPPLSVFRAFVTAETMSRFWFTRRDRGLVAGSTVSWFIGPEEDAYAIEVRVKELVEPELIRIEWWGGEHFTEVVWRFEEVNEGCTRLTIEECGFRGSQQEVVTAALDSTGGFNQVIIALKALLEHDAVINIVADHA